MEKQEEHNDTVVTVEDTIQDTTQDTTQDTKSLSPEPPSTPKLPLRKDEPIHPRAQQKLDDLRRRGIIQ